MQLNNFLEDKVFNSFRRAMGAPLSNYQVVIKLPQPTYKPKITPPIILPLPTEGLEVVGSEITTHFDGTLIYKNKRVLVHIRDASHHLPRFHLANCLTLIEMKSAGRFEKYVVSESENGNFYVRIGSGSLSQRSLPVCQNCLDKLSWKGFDREGMARNVRHSIVQQFSIKEFFLKYPNSLQPVLPVSKVDTAPRNEYPENWALIASELKRQLGYVCQSCHLVVGETYKRYLHVHHLNGLKNDCRVENLKCLCISCHSKEHMHENLLNSSDLIEFRKIFSVN